MKFAAAAFTLLIAAPASAQVLPPPLPDAWHPLAALAYTLTGKDYRGSIVRDGDETGAPQANPRNHRYGQNMAGGFRSMDRETMRIAISDPRSSQVAQGGVGGVQVTIRDLGDQGRGSPATVTLHRADGSIISSFKVDGRRTSVANGNIIRAEYTGWVPGKSFVTITTGTGKMNRPDRDPGDPGQADGFVVKVETIPDCPEDESNSFTVTRSFRGKTTVESGPVRHREMAKSASRKADRGGKDRGGKADRGGKSGGGKGGKGKR